MPGRRAGRGAERPRAALHGNRSARRPDAPSPRPERPPGRRPRAGQGPAARQEGQRRRRTGEARRLPAGVAPRLDPPGLGRAALLPGWARGKRPFPSGGAWGPRPPREKLGGPARPHLRCRACSACGLSGSLRPGPCRGVGGGCGGASRRARPSASLPPPLLPPRRRPLPGRTSGHASESAPSRPEAAWRRRNANRRSKRAADSGAATRAKGRPEIALPRVPIGRDVKLLPGHWLLCMGGPRSFRS